MSGMSEDPNENQSTADKVGYFLAAAILIPIGVYLKANYAGKLGIGSMVVSWFQ